MYYRLKPCKTFDDCWKPRAKLILTQGPHPEVYEHYDDWEPPTQPRWWHQGLHEPPHYMTSCHAKISLGEISPLTIWCLAMKAVLSYGHFDPIEIWVTGAQVAYGTWCRPGSAQLHRSPDHERRSISQRQSWHRCERDMWRRGSITSENLIIHEKLLHCVIIGRELHQKMHL